MISFEFFRKELSKWFNENRENHFFRQDRTAYKTWISEVALQQTRIQAALTPLKRFLDAFPDVYSLAQSDEESVVHAFRGLGYYNRARNLRKGAKFIVENHSGKMPATYQELLKIPSIGPYTASAIASICFQEKVGVIDGNVKRIYARLHAVNQKITSHIFNKNLETFMSSFINSNLPPGDLNEALMEFGQKVCVAKSPECSKCPFNRECKGCLEGKPEEYPVRDQAIEKVKVEWHVLIYKNGNKIAVEKYKDFRFLKSHWGFPSFLNFPGSAMESSAGVKNKIDSAETIGGLSHTITHHKIKFVIYSYTSGVKDEGYEWVLIDDMEKKLAASCLSKVWNIYKKQLDLPGGGLEPPRD
ncbi:MAG: hypothetical protein ABUK01_12070 [Leptospirales bacterium]